MKTKIILAVFVILYSHVLHAQWQGYDPHTNTWEPGSSKQFTQNSTPDNMFLSGWQMKNTQTSLALKIFFLDSLYGWACHNGAPVGIVKSTDGGETWDSVVIFTGTGQLRSIHFIDRHTGWTVGTRVYKTTSGGLNWINIPSLGLGDFSLHTVNFFNHDIGFIGGQFGNSRAMLAKTTNGGMTWDSVFLSIFHLNSSIRSQFWYDSNTGWIGGTNCLLKTTDGGNNFIEYTEYLPFASNGYHAILDIKFANELTGWISGSNVDHRNLHKTTDGGYTWKFQDNPAVPYSFPQLNAIEFLNENTGWGAALVGMIIKTTNGGSDWFIDLSAPTEFRSFSYIKNKRLWCGADWGQAWYLDYGKIVGVSPNAEILPEKFKLFQNYPNPFNPETIINYQISLSGMVTLRIFDIAGKEIAELVNENQIAGTYKFNFNASVLPSGVYLYQLRAGDLYVETKKMVVLK